MEEEGFQIVEAQEAFLETVFTDIGAVAYYLKAVIWQIPAFTIEAYRDRLHALHERMQREGSLRIDGHFFYLIATKPDSRSLQCRIAAPQQMKLGWCPSLDRVLRADTQQASRLGGADPLCGV